MLKLATVLIALSGFYPGLCTPASAQSAPVSAAPRRVPATIVLVDHLPVPGETFVVQRRHDVAPYDVILLRTDASAAQLSDAIRTLMAARAAGGDTAASRATMRMRRHADPGDRLAVLPWTGRVIADLRKAEPKQVAGVGTARAVVIWLPPQRRRGTAP